MDHQTFVLLVVAVIGQYHAGVAKLTWELWGAGGNGHGACSCRRCHHYRGAGGGSFTTKTISTGEGCSYTVCAAGVYRCCSRECVGCYGCASYVNGYNLSNFCAVGGGRGEANTDWSNLCHSTMSCCVQPGSYNSDFGMNAHWPGFSGHWNCHCGASVTQTCSGAAPFIGVGNKTFSNSLLDALWLLDLSIRCRWTGCNDFIL